MKKTSFIFLFIISILCLIGCDVNPPISKVVDHLSIYSVNDFHGALEEDIISGKGAARVAGYINSQKELLPSETVVISAGDMFQGTGISNYNHGLDVINVMNMIGFDAMTLGNHEFDWTLNEVTKYFDGNKTNGEANFPLLGSNVIEKSTAERPDYVDSYTLIERGGLNILIVGFIGFGLEEDIATSMVKDYKFLNPRDVVEETIKDARKATSADIVIASVHDYSYELNAFFAGLEGDALIDAVINGHSHSKVEGKISRDNYADMPYVQGGSSGAYVGKIDLTINPETKSVTNAESTTVKMSKTIKTDPLVEKYVLDLVESTAHIFQRVIGQSGNTIDRYGCAQYASDALEDYAKAKYGKCDIAFINIGGIRANAFDISANTDITIAKIYEIIPFDNNIKLVTLTGKQIKGILSQSEIIESKSVTGSEGAYYINGEELDDNKTYRVCAISYIFDLQSYPFINGTDIINSEVLFRDVVIESIENLTKNNEKWFV